MHTDCCVKTCDKPRHMSYYVCIEHAVVYAHPRYTEHLVVKVDAAPPPDFTPTITPAPPVNSQPTENEMPPDAPKGSDSTKPWIGWWQ